MNNYRPKRPFYFSIRTMLGQWKKAQKTRWYICWQLNYSSRRTLGSLTSTNASRGRWETQFNVHSRECTHIDKSHHRRNTRVTVYTWAKIWTHARQAKRQVARHPCMAKRQAWGSKPVPPIWAFYQPPLFFVSFLPFVKLPSRVFNCSLHSSASCMLCTTISCHPPSLTMVFYTLIYTTKRNSFTY